MILDYDIICLTETHFTHDLQSEIFKDFKCYSAKAVKLSLHGRASGGVLVLIRNTLVPFCHAIDSGIDNCIALKLTRELFGTSKPLLMLNIYIPPSESDYYRITQNGHGLEQLDECIANLLDAHDCHLMICGDLNARTGQLNAQLSQSDDDLWDLLSSRNASDDDALEIDRFSEDLIVNVFGRQLLELCEMLDCVILNGLKKADFDGKFTYVSQSGASVSDYFVISRELLSEVCMPKFLVLARTESDHMPVCLHIQHKLHNNFSRTLAAEGRDVCVNKLVWNPDFADQYVYGLNANNQFLLDITRNINLDYNQALTDFNHCLTSAASCMVKRIKVSPGLKRGAVWFDRECRLAKSRAKSCLHQFRRKLTPESRLNYTTSRKQYKELLLTKRKYYLLEKVRLMCDPNTNIKLFWSEVKKSTQPRSNRVSTNITQDQWLNHFKNLFSTDQQFHAATHEDNNKHEIVYVDTLDGIITVQEIKTVLHKLKTGKSSGLDDISPEMLKLLNGNAITFLKDFFNYIFEHGLYPDEWAKAIIVPIFKKGNSDLVDNYRGISLLSAVSKCYTAILNKRLYSWLEDNNKISESQAGFRKGYSSVDHIFTLNAIVQKCLSKRGGKCYVAFVDFKKAFDLVQHDELFKALHSVRVSSKLILALKAMYSSMLSCVRNNCELTDFFECPVGVRQGCALSPTLFSVFINEIANYMQTSGRHGIQFLPGLLELYVLLFADDLSLLSFTPAGLRNQLQCLQTCCARLKLSVNIEKTKIIVFRKGGFLGANEAWYFEGKRLDVVNIYKYLGYNFSTMLSIPIGTHDLVLKARQATYEILRMLRQYKNLDRKTFFKIFDSKIASILLYASEVWGYQQVDEIEKVHLVACKRFLGLPRGTPNSIVYGELGRFPLHVISNLRCIKYWFKLLSLDETRLPLLAYKMLVSLDERGKRCWVTNIKELLFRTGFGIVWLHQGAGNMNLFLKMFKTRLTDMFVQKWHETMDGSDRYVHYASFKDLLVQESYIDYFSVPVFRCALTMFRAGMFPVNANLFRFEISNVKRKCPFCPDCIEDENHFLFVCPLYRLHRNRFITPNRHDMRNLSVNSLLWLDMTLLKNLACYLVYAQKIRCKSIN